MRLECPHCRTTVEPADVAVDPASGQIRFLCPACGAPSVEPVTIQEASFEAVGVDPGLDQNDDRAARDDGGSALQPPPRRADTENALWIGWDRVAEDFEDRSSHDAFLVTCEALGALRFAATRYREWADSHPDDTRVRAHLDRVGVLAQMSSLAEASRAERERDPIRRALVLSLVLVALLILAILMAPFLIRGLGGAGKRGGSGVNSGGRKPRMENLVRPRPVRAASQAPRPRAARALRPVRAASQAPRPRAARAGPAPGTAGAVRPGSMPRPVISR